MKTISLSLRWAQCLSPFHFGTTPDFTVTDIDGNTHELYADILDQGLIAVVDVCNVVWYAAVCINRAHCKICTKRMALMAPIARVIWYGGINNRLMQCSVFRKHPWELDARSDAPDCQ